MKEYWINVYMSEFIDFIPHKTKESAINSAKICGGIDYRIHVRMK